MVLELISAVDQLDTNEKSKFYEWGEGWEGTGLF